MSNTKKLSAFYVKYAEGLTFHCQICTEFDASILDMYIHTYIEISKKVKYFLYLIFRYSISHSDQICQIYTNSQIDIS